MDHDVLGVLVEMLPAQHHGGRVSLSIFQPSWKPGPHLFCAGGLPGKYKLYHLRWWDRLTLSSPLLSLIIMQVLFSPGNSSVYIQMCGFGPSTFTGCIDNVENGFKYKFCSCDTDGLVEDDLYTWCSPFISLFFSCNRNLEALQSSAERTTYNWRVIVPLIIIQQTVFEYK